MLHNSETYLHYIDIILLTQRIPYDLLTYSFDLFLDSEYIGFVTSLTRSVVF